MSVDLALKITRPSSFPKHHENFRTQKATLEIDHIRILSIGLELQQLAMEANVGESFQMQIIFIIQNIVTCPNMVTERSIFVVRTGQISCDIHNFVCRGEKW